MYGCLGASPFAVSMMSMRRSTPTCTAASPMPGAAYIVSSMSFRKARTLSSTVSTGSDVLRRMGSGSVMIGSFGILCR